MLFKRHASIISYHIDMAPFNLTGWKIPVTGEADIRLFNRFGVDKEFPVTKFDLLSPQGNHPFKKHDPVSSKTDSHNIKPLRAGKEITQFKTEINTAIVIGRFHTVPFNQKRCTDISKKEIGRKGNKGSPDHKLRRQGREKELADFFMHRSIIRDVEQAPFLVQMRQPCGPPTVSKL